MNVSRAPAIGDARAETLATDQPHATRASDRTTNALKPIKLSAPGRGAMGFAMLSGEIGIACACPCEVCSRFSGLVRISNQPSVGVNPPSIGLRTRGEFRTGRGSLNLRLLYFLVQGEEGATGKPDPISKRLVRFPETFSQVASYI